MNAVFLEKNLRILAYQRNIFATLSLLMAGSLLIVSCFLFLKNEKVIVTPPIVEKEFWIDGNQVSPTYLEQYGLFLGQLLLGNSAQSSASQRTTLLRHTDASFSGVLRKRLLEEEELLTKQNATYVFFPIEVKTNLRLMEVTLMGDRVAYAAGRQVSTDRESYVLGFNYSGSRLLLKSVVRQEAGR